jgi:hypothetical protein
MASSAIDMFISWCATASRNCPGHILAINCQAGIWSLTRCIASRPRPARSRSAESGVVNSRMSP